MHALCKRMLSVRIQFVSVCSVYVHKLYAYAQHTCIFEKMKYRGKARQADKILSYTEHPNHVALNDGKKNLGPKSHTWAPLKGLVVVCMDMP